jgi:hypothetical protein
MLVDSYTDYVPQYATTLTTNRHKLAIVGTHPHTRGNAPWDDESYDIWVFNEAPQFDWCLRWDAVFQLHGADVYTSPWNHSHAQHWQWLQQPHGAEKIIYMQAYDPRVPNSVEYPLAAVLAHFPRRYFKLSAAYALALAILQGYTEIHYWGMELTSDTEYTYQADCWRYWVGVADGRGVDIVNHCNHNLFDESLYGYDGEVGLGREYFAERAALLEAEWRAAEKELKQKKDKFADACYKPDHAKATALALECVEAAIASGEKAGALSGAEKFAKYPQSYVSRQEFEKLAAQAQINGVEEQRHVWRIGGSAEYVWNVWWQTQSLQARDQFMNFIGAQIQKAYDVGAMSGAYAEAMGYIRQYDDKLQNAGGAKTRALIEKERGN